MFGYVKFEVQDEKMQSIDWRMKVIGKTNCGTVAEKADLNWKL